MATVKVNATLCDRTHYVRVTMRDDGIMDVDIVSDCEKVKEYGDQLGTLSMADLGNITMSRIMDPRIVEHLTPTCLAPVAVFNAAWLESGLMSRSLALKVAEESIEFIE